MNSRRWLLLCGATVLLASCEQSAEVSIPTFADGGLLRSGAALSRKQLYLFEGMFSVPQGGDLLGGQVAVRTSRGTVSVLTDKNAGFSVLGAACLPDRRVVLEGYWQYPTRVEAGLVRLFVEPPEVAGTLCDGGTPTPTTALRLTGTYGQNGDLPGTPLALTWAHELKPWRGRFFNVAHHGACENTDHCGTSPNTLESVRLAERVGSNAAELDVRVTRDGIPILFHDPGLSSSLVKGLFCNGNIADLSLAEIRGSCASHYGEVIPTVDEALTMMTDETELEGIYLDIKVPEAVLPTARLASKLFTRLRERNTNADPNDDRAFAPIVGIPKSDVLDAWRAAKVTLQAEGLEIPPCLIEYDPDLVISEGCAAWGPTWTTGPQVDNVHKVQGTGRLVVFWTINQSDFLDRFLTDAHPDGIITSRAALLFHHYQTIGTPPPVRPGVDP